MLGRVVVVVVLLVAWGGDAGATPDLRRSSTSYHGMSPACDVKVGSTVGPRLVEPDELVVEGTLSCAPSGWQPTQTNLSLWREPGEYVGGSFVLYSPANLRLEVDDPLGGVYHAYFGVQYVGSFSTPPVAAGTPSCTGGFSSHGSTLYCVYEHVFVVAAAPV